jgi:hypothetical protein
MGNILQKRNKVSNLSDFELEKTHAAPDSR